MPSIDFTSESIAEVVNSDRAQHTERTKAVEQPEIEEPKVLGGEAGQESDTNTEDKAGESNDTEESNSQSPQDLTPPKGNEEEGEGDREGEGEGGGEKENGDEKGECKGEGEEKGEGGEEEPKTIENGSTEELPKEGNEDVASS